MAVKAIPDGYYSLTPYLVIKGAADAIEYYKKVFGATETVRMPGPGGAVMHAEIKIGDSHIMMGQANEKYRAMPGSVLLYVADCDALYNAALKAGAKSVQELKDQFYGDRSGGVEDPTGNHWWISTHVEDVSPEELARRMKTMQPA